MDRKFNVRMRCRHDIRNALVTQYAEMTGVAWSMNRRFPVCAFTFAVVIGCLTGQSALAQNTELVKPMAVIIETTDNDIELQVFADPGDVVHLRVFDPQERRIFRQNAKRELRRQGGLSELFFASKPSPFPADALAPSEQANEVVREFLQKFPAGVYEFEGQNIDGVEIEGEATLTHVLPALPEIISPVSAGADPPVVDPNNLVIEWAPVTTRFIGDGPVEIIEYQVILDPVDEREIPWVDGVTRRGLINVPGTVTSLTVPPEYLLRGAEYEFEVLAIEASGNSTISVGEFVTSN